MFCLLALLVILLYTGTQFYGLHDAEAMDAGQLARNLWRGRGYVTQNLRPFEFWYLNSIGRPPLDTNTNAQVELWTPPMYPLVLSTVFHVLTPNFDISGNVRTLAADRVVMMVGWVTYLVGMVLLYLLAREMFDHRVATMSVFMYLFCNPLLESAIAGLPLGLMSVFFLLTAYAVFKAEKWQAEGPVEPVGLRGAGGQRAGGGVGHVDAVRVRLGARAAVDLRGDFIPATVAGQMRVVFDGVRTRPGAVGGAEYRGVGDAIWIEPVFDAGGDRGRERREKSARGRCSGRTREKSRRSSFASNCDER